MQSKSPNKPPAAGLCVCVCVCASPIGLQLILRLDGMKQLSGANFSSRVNILILLVRISKATPRPAVKRQSSAPLESFSVAI